MIKLFGMTIQLVPNKDEDNQLTSSTTTTTTSHDTKDPTQSNHEESFGTEEAVEQANEEPRTPKVDEETSIAERGDPIILSGINEDPETSSVADTNEKEDPNDTSNSDEKTLKQPDKLLPCPRCSSLDTKFCYYNNYNVSQPRHFCKKCQRYWTAGGTMRNVPVGSGRRKNKCSPASQYRQIIVSESLQDARAGPANGIYQRNGNLLAFGSDSPHCESMVSAVNYMEKSENHVRNRCFEISEPRLPFFSGAQETGDDDSTRASSTVLNHNEKVSCTGDKSKLKNIQESPTQVPCFPVPPWASPSNTAEWMSATQQPFRPSGFPISFYPTSNTQTLGKHCRDGSMVGSSDTEKVELEAKDLKRGVLTPKTLRIHDPVEAAKTSIWSTLGIKNEHTKPVNEAIRHEAFRAKGVQRYHMNKAASYGFASKPCSLATVI